MSDDLISRQAAIKDAESWVAVDEYEKHLQKNVVEWLKEFPSAEHGTNLAQVGTDLISRQAAIDALLAWMNDPEDDRDSAFDVLMQLPPIQPKRGKWINCDGGIATCSICGDRWGVYGVMNFCPSCGAKMEVTT